MKLPLLAVVSLVVVIGLMVLIHQTETDTAHISDERDIAASRTPAKRGPVRSGALQPVGGSGPVFSRPGGEPGRIVPNDLDEDEQPGNEWLWDWFDRQILPPIDDDELEQFLPPLFRPGAAEAPAPHRPVQQGQRDAERTESEERHPVYHYGAMPAEFPRWFTDIDGNRDGQVDRFEWNKAHMPEALFQQFDLNDDGLITPEEMQRFLAHAPKVDLQLVPRFDPPSAEDDDPAESRLSSKE